MTVDRAASQGAIQETAQALVARGDLLKAVKLLDRFLSEFDGDWGVWLYFAGLCARLNRRDEAVAAYRACARQLEGDGHYARARDALMSAARVAPRDASLRRDIERLTGRSAPAKAPPPKRDPAQETFLVLPRVEPSLKKERRLPDPAAHLTAVIPGRVKRRASPLPEVTDPYIAIFDILDAERAEAAAKGSQTRRDRAARAH